MLKGLDFSTIETVVEYGPGTGVFTRAVMEAMQGTARPRPGRIIAIERNPRMAAALPAQLPSADSDRGTLTVVEADALSVHDVLDREGVEHVDLIVSGLGWPSIPPQPRRAILEHTEDVLRPGSQFRTFGYHIGLCMPGAWDFRSTCRELFERMDISPVVWLNLPPAFVYTCTKRRD